MTRPKIDKKLKACYQITNQLAHYHPVGFALDGHQHIIFLSVAMRYHLTGISTCNLLEFAMTGDKDFLPSWPSQRDFAQGSSQLTLFWNTPKPQLPNYQIFPNCNLVRANAAFVTWRRLLKFICLALLRLNVAQHKYT